MTDDTAKVGKILHEVDLLFEPSEALHGLLSGHQGTLLERSPGGRVSEDLVTFVGDVLVAGSGSREVDAVLNAHPRLGATTIESAQSVHEQRNLTASSAAERDRLKVLNEAYEARFPGLRYVVFVNGRSRAVVMDDMARRIERGSVALERREAIAAMVDIALDRLRHRSA
ncbi:Putative uncharacterized protein [Taphrina deformans PYCC 5710]|uniref:Oxo-4-hydroxy-4-carboxy-5-ureidoimidazoline decarboxylase domain-containing protein n=1 Tax=Taphrina deformans (strain PYCC 5710 / ATCC 11124 / CBS 356.35 / IMI 108563 / JCM 9778 / NBRC 8474) TaxID=1097556 RepID=R4XEN6_TAPDE|nr:Putative uncharacterized protein [Taphrina deformans PYCC 5710]|eukprot:CCG82936.1 Putative uncharacterized protein [Taphrina deformans PYCC 5710]